MEIVDIRVRHLEANFIPVKPSLPVSRIRNKLKQLGSKYVFVPADKAGNNVVVV